MGPRAVPRQRRGSRRRHHDPRVSGAGRSIERDGVVRRVGGHARDVSGYGLNETDAGRRVVARRRGERLRHDDPGAVDPEMQLLPAPLAAAAVFRRGPLPPPNTDSPVLSTTRSTGPWVGTRSRTTARGWPRRDSVVWSGASSPVAISVRTDRTKPSVWRSGRRKTSRSVNAVSIAWSENLRGPPGRPDNPGVQAAIASGES